MMALDFSIFYQIVLFLILWAVLSRVLFRPYLKVLEVRERETAGAHHDTEALEREGARLKAEYEELLARAMAAGNAAKEAILQEARQQRERIIGQAREEATALLDKVREDIQTQLDKERQRVMAESADVAREMVSKILGRDVA
ncbi:MAG: ATP synthase F0 subunit B [Alphaproteobacteria bacterium]